MRSPSRDVLSSAALVVVVLALAANAYSTHVTRMALRASDVSARLKQYAGSEARLFELGGAVIAENNARAAAIDDAKSKYRVSQAPVTDDVKAPAGTVAGYFDGTRPVLYESAFWSNGDFVTTRYYLDAQSRPFLVVKTTSHADNTGAKPTAMIETTHFLGGIYVMSETRDSPMTRATETRGTAPDSANELLMDAVRLGARLGR